MATEIVAFLLTISGLILVSSTVPTDYWKVSSVDGTVITTATFWSNLWKTCVTDSTGVSSAKTSPHIQVCRGLMIAVVCLGFFGGSDTTKARLTVLSGICCLTACSIYAHRITTDFFDPIFVAQKFELGTALFIGWSGSVLCILGGLYCASPFLRASAYAISIKKKRTWFLPGYLSSCSFLISHYNNLHQMPTGTSNKDQFFHLCYENIHCSRERSLSWIYL
uniref:Claudin n=1 Tax=Poecilia mexicana TaxID=48701 RepID=A0A3B3YD51_9TELE